MSANLSAIFYLISGVLFILALRGLSSPETSRRGNFFGILGMVIAITVTFLSIGNFSSGFIYVLIFLLIGGSVGAFVAFKIPMTAMPELVAGFHSLVGLAAVFVAISAFLNPEAFNLGTSGNIKLGTLIEMSIGASVGAITFSGSIIAFLKLKGIMAYNPIISGQLSREEIELSSKEKNRPLQIKDTDIEISSADKKIKKYIPLSKRQDKPDSTLWLIKHHPQLKDSQIAKLIGITKNSVTSIRNKSYWNYNSLSSKDPVAMSLFSQKDLIEAIEKAERRIKREKKEKEKTKQAI